MLRIDKPILLVVLLHLRVAFCIDCDLQFWPQLSRSKQLPQAYSKSSPNTPNTPQQPVLQSGETMLFVVNCSCCNQPAEVIKQVSPDGQPRGNLFYRFFSENRYSTIVSRSPNVDPVIRSRFESTGDMSTKYEECKHFPLCAILYTPVTPELANIHFWVEANLLGRSDIRVELVWINSTPTEQPDDIPIPSALSEKELRKKTANKRRQFEITLVAQGVIPGGNATASHVTIFLKPQIFYTVFDWAVFFIACTISLSAGCSTDPRAFRKQLKRALPIGIGLVVHLLVTPLIGLAAGYASSLPPEKAYGLFVTTTLQVGGATVVVISISDCHKQFALALAQIANVLNLATSPLWIYVVGTYLFRQPIFLLRFCGLISLVALVQILGFGLRCIRPALARAVLTWFSHPFLLLSAILFITLGVYINQYVFHAPQPMAYLQHVGLALFLMVTTSYTCGWLIGHILHLSVLRSRAIANQLSVYQGFLAIPLLRICIPSPEGELASAIALWTVFLTPVPLVYNAVLKFVIRTAKGSYEAYKQKMRKRGPTAMLCADSLAAVAFTSMILPAPTESNNRNTFDGLFDDASSSTVNSNSGSQRRCKSTAIHPTFFKESTTDSENRERILDALARKGGIFVSEKRTRKNGGIPRTPHHHPRSMDDVCGIPGSWGGGGGVLSPPPLPPPPPCSKPLF